MLGFLDRLLIHHGQPLLRPRPKLRSVEVRVTEQLRSVDVFILDEVLLTELCPVELGLDIIPMKDFPEFSDFHFGF